MGHTSTEIFGMESPEVKALLEKLLHADSVIELLRLEVELLRESNEVQKRGLTIIATIPQEVEPLSVVTARLTLAESEKVGSK